MQSMQVRLLLLSVFVLMIFGFCFICVVILLPIFVSFYNNKLNDSAMHFVFFSVS